MFVVKVIFSIVMQMAIFGGLLFVPAATWAWWRAWCFLGVVFAATVATMLGVFPGNEGLLDERLKPLIQTGQPLADKVIVLLLGAAFCGVIAFIPLDVFRFHLLGSPGRVVSSLGLLLFVVGWWLIALALRENTFAAPVVKVQRERHQTVVDTGVYARVRHPMYAGAVPLLIGMALWLESYAAALLAGVPIGLLVVRIHVEEQFLRRALPGYEAYMARVPYRLIPFLW